jgi:hypothetical protein
LRIGLLDDDDALVLDDSGFHLLLFGGLQTTLVLSPLAHPLNGIHDVALLRQKGIAQVNRPLDVVSQALYHVRKGRQSLDTRIPRLFRHRIREGLIFQVLVAIQPPLEQNDFQRIRGRGQYLGQQRVWIQGNRRYQRIQLLGRKLGRLAPG